VSAREQVSSFAVSACAALVLTSMTTVDYQNDFHRTSLPLMLTAVGCVAVVGTCALSMYVWPVDHKKDAERVMLQLIPVASVMATVGAYGATRLMLPTHMRSDLGVEPLERSSNVHVTPFEVWLCVVGGIWLASLLALCQQRFVSPEARTVRQMAESCKTGQAANLIFGVSVGYRSTLAFATALGAVVYLSYEVADYWGVGFAAVGAMTTFGLSAALEMSSAIFDNALAISDMAGLADEPRSAVAALALAGRSVSATSKSLSIASATLAGVAAWAAFNFTAQVRKGPPKPAPYPRQVREGAHAAQRLERQHLLVRPRNPSELSALWISLSHSCTAGFPLLLALHLGQQRE
jgi:inorganic pyrophosphatase